MFQLKSLSYGQGQQTLIEDASVAIPRGAKVGFVGANGSGKSSLFKLILGEIEAEFGEYFIPKNCQINHVAQEVPSSTQSVLDFVLDGYQAYRSLQQTLEQAHVDGDYDAQIKGYEDWEAIDGEQVPIQATKILIGLGFSQEQVSAQVDAFSGGWRVRMQLARALLAPSELLLMDEPTNHLDLEAIIWLEKWCQQYQGTMVVIAHDVAFLDKVADHILHIEQKQLNLYKGNYSTFVKTRAEKIALNEKARAKQQKEREHLESFINRFKAKASKAKQAQSRVKRLAKMEDIAAMHATSTVKFSFEQVEAPNPLIRIQKGALGYNDQPLLSKLNLYLAPGDRLALLGKNGEGKSTLVKCLANQLPLMQGDMTVANKLRIGYFAQHQIEALSLEKSPYDIIAQKRPTWNELMIRQCLGGFQFVGDKVFLQVKSLSGGERARLALALLLLDKPQVILLDEPTNHLDIEMREALALALQDFNGALVVVSHDRAFIEACCDSLLLVDSGRVEPYQETLEDYAQWVRNPKIATKEVTQTKKAKPSNYWTNQIKKQESLIEEFEQGLKLIDAKLESSALYDNPKALEDTLNEREKLRAKLAEAESSWEQAQLALEQDKEER